jgi:hypothetical protein
VALDGLARDLFADAAFAAIVQQDLEQGQHRNETTNWDYFTTAYFHRPEELQVELASTGFTCRAVLGLEGPAWILSDFDERWTDTRAKDRAASRARWSCYRLSDFRTCWQGIMEGEPTSHAMRRRWRGLRRDSGGIPF